MKPARKRKTADLLETASIEAEKDLKARRLFFRAILFNVLAIIVAILLGLRLGRPEKYFGEHQFTTWISTLQLLIVSWLNYRTYRIRRLAAGYFLTSSCIIWALISFGFLYLACDEYFLFHEAIDHRIHELFSLQETALTDRFDDMIVGLYGLIGLYALYVCRQEIKQYREALPFLLYGFVLGLAMVGTDTVTNRPDFFNALFRKEVADSLVVWVAVSEDSFKLLAEACFIAGSYNALTISRGIGTLLL